MRLRAVVLIQIGSVPAEKQLVACQAHAASMGYLFSALLKTADHEQAAALIRTGKADVVIVAYGGQALAAHIAAAGGWVEAVHPTPHVVDPPPQPQPIRPARIARRVAEVIIRIYHKRHSVVEVADLTGESTGDVTLTLLAAGVKNPKR